MGHQLNGSEQRGKGPVPLINREDSVSEVKMGMKDCLGKGSLLKAKNRRKPKEKEKIVNVSDRREEEEIKN